jgi:hypothetical protein
MPIVSLDNYIAASRQRVRICKTASRTVVSTVNFSVFDIAGTPGAGVLAGTNTVNGGIVPTDATAGCPIIDFTSGTSYLSKVEYGSSVACRLSIFDMIVKMGAIAYTASTTTPTADTQPTITQRCPDYPGSGTVFGARNEIWIEVSTAFVTGTAWQVQVTYKNQAGTAGRTTIISAAQAAAALTLGKMFQLALQAGDTGVQRIESVIVTNGGTAMTAGAFNVLILRPIYTSMRCMIANDGDVHDMLKTGLPVIYNDSALIMTVQADSTASGIPELAFELANNG